MFKTFVTGVFLGLVAAAALLYFVPVVNQQRETSIISVNPNGGNSETFHINIPMDRIMVGAQSRSTPLPTGMNWPEFAEFEGLRTEMFKVRNARNAVIGVASRLAASSDEQAAIVEWVLHFPARGSMYLSMQNEPVEGGYRIGEMRAGSKEFVELTGRVVERWVPDQSGSGDGRSGRIELVSQFVGVLEEEPVEEEVL